MENFIIVYSFSTLVLALIISGASSDRNSDALKISTDLIPFKKSESKTTIEWYESYAAQTYCVSDRISGLKFTCETCDDDQQKFLRESTNDMTSLANYPAIKIHGPLRNGYKWNDKKLTCTGYDSDGTLVSVSVTIVVYYLRKPTILTSFLHRPIEENGIYRFFFNENQTYNLLCHVDANPNASTFHWSVDGQWIGQGQTFKVTGRAIGKAISCKANNGKPDSVESHQIYVEKYVFPSLVKRDFGQGAGLKHTVPVGYSTELKCSFIAHPKPLIQWMMADYDSDIRPITCNKRFPDIESTYQDPIFPSRRVWNVTSTCSLHLTKFDQLGNYWCKGCIEIAENTTVCDVAPNSIPSYSLYLNVTGSPTSDGKSPRIERNVNQPSLINVYVPFCANPAPDTARSHLLIDDQPLFLTGNRHGISFKEIKRNDLNPFCYESFLEFDSSEDKGASYKFVVSNSLGNFSQLISFTPVPTINSTDLNAVEVDTVNSDSVTLAISLSLAAFLIIGVCIFIYLWINRKACFSYRKTDEKSLDCTKENRNGDLFPDSNPADSATENENNAGNEVKPSSWNGKGYHYVSNEVIV